MAGARTAATGASSIAVRRLTPWLTGGSRCYGPGGLLIDEVLEVDRELSRVRVRMPTHADLPITREQRAHPIRHPRHVSGGLMVHMTGVAGLVHAYYVRPASRTSRRPARRS